MIHRIRSRIRFNEERRRKWVEGWASSLPEGSKVLDVGAGVGQYRPLFANCRYYAHDFGQEPATVGNYTKLDYVSDITEIPVEDASFDVVLCTEVLEHVPQPIEAIREMGRILRPGGRLLCSAPLGSWLHQEPYHFYGGYTPHWYRQFLPQFGLEVEAIERNYGFFSYFGQEAIRFNTFIAPRYVFKKGLIGLLLVPVWAVTWPVSRLFTLVAPALDRLNLEVIATVGYHVVATKRGP